MGRNPGVIRCLSSSVEFMIIAVEGPSAAGKTTFCRGLDQTFVTEYRPTGREPDSDDVEVPAHYWANVSTSRWNAARILEGDTGLAVCDSDPMKLHHTWSLARIGAVPAERFEIESVLVREALVEKRIGFVDTVLVDFPAPEVLRDRRDKDTSRERTDFEFHLQLIEPMREWYRALDSVDPGRVLGWDVDIDTLRPRDRRYDASLFDALLAALPSL